MLLLVQTSLLVVPLYLEDEPPECRSLRAIAISHAGSEGAPRGFQRSREEALAIAERMGSGLAGGARFEELARELRGAAGGVFTFTGTFGPGMLPVPIDRFLFEAEILERSDPIETPAGFHLVERVDREAGCLQILVAHPGEEGRERCERLLEELREGADFRSLARERSDDAASAARGGELAIFERGPEDLLLKEAVFRAEVGEVVGPIESPLGWHLLMRVPPAQIDPALREVSFVRARAILVAFRGTAGSVSSLQRTPAEAEGIAASLAARIRAGEDMAALAREHDDDRGGRERDGDLGWLRRRTPQVPAELDRLFVAPIGEVVGPIHTPAGWLVARAEARR